MSTRKALIVGVNDYPGSPLQSCVNDAQEVAGLLEMKEYNFDVTILLNEKATRRAILTALTELFLGKPDYVVFYFAGHGVTDDLSTYLVSIDTDSVDIGVDLEFLKRLINSKAAENTTVIMFLDCCHSGAASVRSLAVPNTTTRDITKLDIDQALTILGTGKIVMAACQSHELAYEKVALQHGIFTYFLLEGMYGNAADNEGKVTVVNLYDYVSNRFEQVTRQTPVFKGDIVGRIILGENLTPRDRLEPLLDQANQIESEAQKIMNDYIGFTATNIENWSHSRYRDACAMLLPRLRWFNRQLEQYPKLAMRPKFRSAYSTAQSKLSDLGHLFEGLMTNVGTVKTRIGSGTFGTVWEVCSDDGQNFAYKIYHPSDLGNYEKLSRFNRGYRAMAQLNHPNIVKVHQFMECPVGFVMDYINGSNLRNFVDVERDPVEILRQLLTVGETLQHAHTREVVHRDVKPENIIMRFEEDKNQYLPYLTDFDLAWFTTATQFTREGLGSLIYAAPEQLAKSNSSLAHAPTTDIYAFGQLCFFFICKRDPVPMLADNTYALREALMSWSVEEPIRRLISLYEQCTATNASKRIQYFREICDQLFEISQLLSVVDHKKVIGFTDFTRQLAFSIVGMYPEKMVSDTSFYTTSGQTFVNITAKNTSKNTEVCFQINVQSLPVIDVATYKESRDVLNQRIDTALRPFSQQSYRRPGTNSPFETFIFVKDVPMSIDGVELCRPIVMRVIEAIDSV